MKWKKKKMKLNVSLILELRRVEKSYRWLLQQLKQEIFYFEKQEKKNKNITVFFFKKRKEIQI